MKSQITTRRGKKSRRLLTLGAVIATGTLVMGACSNSGGTGSSATIPGNVTTTTVKGSSPTTGSATSPSTSVPELYGALPPVGTPTNGGTITMGQLTGSTPTFIFPIVPDVNSSVYTTYWLQDQLFVPLYMGPVGATPTNDYSRGAANKPIFSDGNKTVTIPLKTNLKWSDGQPVDANDLLFEIALLKQAVKESAGNWNAYTPGFFPESVVSATAPNTHTVVLHLNKAYNPGFFLNNQLGSSEVYPLPNTAWNVASAGGAHLDWKIPANAKKIFDYLSKAGGQLAQFGTNPLWQDVDGPFKLTSFSATNSSYTLEPNSSYGGSPKPRIARFEMETETSITPMLTAFKTGGLDVASIDFSQLGQVDSLRSGNGSAVYGYPQLGWFGAFYNFKDKTDHFNSIIGQLYARQVLAHLEDQPAYLTGIFKNAGVLAYGPVPSAPRTPYTPSDAVHTPYPFSVAAATALLKGHGWKVVPNGQTTCAKAGTGPGECGAGIPAGTPFKFTWYYIPAAESPSSGLESESLASEAKQVGIDIELQSKTFNYLYATFNDANIADAKYTNDWGVENFGGFTDAYYPTQFSIFNTGGDYNQGGYDNPTANKLINHSLFSSDPKAVTNEASFLTKDLPIMFMPNSDYIYAVSKNVGGSAESFLALTQFTLLPQAWYVTKS